jgi:hypothetical protein
MPPSTCKTSPEMKPASSEAKKRNESYYILQSHDFRLFNLRPPASWGDDDGPWKGTGPPLLGDADLIHKPPASIRFAHIKHTLAVTVEPFKFSPAKPVAYELS